MLEKKYNDSLLNLLNIFSRKCNSFSYLNINSFLETNRKVINKIIPKHISEALESYPLDPKEIIPIYRSSIIHIDLFFKSFIVHINAINNNSSQKDDKIDVEHLTDNFKFMDHFKDYYYFKSDTEDSKDIILIIDLKSFIVRNRIQFINKFIFKINTSYVDESDNITKKSFILNQFILISNIITKHLNNQNEITTEKLLNTKIRDKVYFLFSKTKLPVSIQNQINTNLKVLNDWKEIYSINPGNLNQKIGLNKNSLNFTIDTSLINAELNHELLNKVYDSNTLENKNVDGICIHSDCYSGLNYLLSMYSEKISCIYIDPPYNTGSTDFQYNNSFKSIYWKSMMYNNLSLAYQLLKEDGVIFISIDDNELVNLRLICDEIFDRFIGMFTWQKKTQPSFLTKEFISVTEYILCYKKGKSQIKLKGGFTDPNKHTELLNISNEVTERYLPKNNTLVYKSGSLFTGQIKSGIYGNEKLKVVLKNNVDVEEGIPSKDILMSGRFRWRQEKINLIHNEKRTIKIKSLSTLRPTISGSGIKKIKAPISLLSKKINGMPTNTDANSEMKNLFKVPPFYYPKPVELIKFLIDSVTYNKPDSLILDFFAGSGTTGQAVMELNNESNTKRKFILVESGKHFETILIPRMKKILTTFNWKKGIPQDFNGKGGVIQYYKLKTE